MCASNDGMFLVWNLNPFFTLGIPCNSAIVWCVLQPSPSFEEEREFLSLPAGHPSSLANPFMFSVSLVAHYPASSKLSMLVFSEQRWLNIKCLSLFKKFKYFLRIFWNSCIRCIILFLLVFWDFFSLPGVALLRSRCLQIIWVQYFQLLSLHVLFLLLVKGSV